MLPVSRSSPENSRPLGLLFSNNLNLHIKISNFLAKSDHFEHFLKNSISEIFTSVLTHFVWEKIDFEIFNLLDESEDSEHFSKNFEVFLKKFIFENFYKYFDPFWMEKIDFEILNLLDESEDSEHFPKNFEHFLKKSISEIFYKCFDPFWMEKIDFEILNLLDESEDSEHFSKNFELFWKNSFLKILQVFWPILYGENWFWDFWFTGQIRRFLAFFSSVRDNIIRHWVEWGIMLSLTE